MNVLLMLGLALAALLLFDLVRKVRNDILGRH
jgi:hypothetical protein